MTKQVSRLSESRYADDRIKTGEIYKEDPIRGDTYRVTKWAERGDGGIVALEKEVVDDG